MNPFIEFCELDLTHAIGNFRFGYGKISGTRHEPSITQTIVIHPRFYISQLKSFFLH